MATNVDNKNLTKLELLNELQSLYKTIALLKIQISAVHACDVLSSLDNKNYEFNIISPKIQRQEEKEGR